MTFRGIFASILTGKFWKEWFVMTFGMLLTAVAGAEVRKGESYSLIHHRLEYEYV